MARRQRPEEVQRKAIEIADRIRGRRKQLGLSQRTLARRVGCQQSQISDWENGNHQVGESWLPHLLRGLAYRSVEDLTVGPDARRFPPITYASNPKPLRLGDVVLDRVVLMAGNSKDVLDFTVQYSHVPLVVPADIRPLYKSLAAKTEDRARAAGRQYYISPTVALRKVGQAGKQLASGEEARGYILELVPLSWEEFIVLNTYLDDDLFPGTVENTIRKRYAKADQVFYNTPDLSWCALGLLFSIVLVPITADGYGLFHLRSRTGVAVEADRWMCGVAENMHRFLDEAAPHDLAKRLNALGRSAEVHVDHHYRPKGVPSPLLTALRGVNEELSPSLYRMLEGAPGRVKFINVIFSFEHFNPIMIGLVDLPLTRDELHRVLEEDYPRDHSERTALEYLALDPANQSTATELKNEDRWSMVGLAGLITAIHFWLGRG